MTEEKKRRHKWEKKVNHINCHESVCVNCGCVKDEKALFNIVYWVDGKPHAKAPDCKPIKVEP